jgi:hypothetical protein
VHLQPVLYSYIIITLVANVLGHLSVFF